MSHKWSQLSYYPWLIFAVTATGTFMSTLDASIVNVALPVIAKNLSADLHTVQWVVLAYLLTISSLLPLFGRIGDMIGRKTVYTGGFVIFSGGSFLCGAAGSIGLLIAARILQAVGASMLMSIAPAIIASTFPGSTRGRALGMVGSVVALGSMTGPGVGGILVGFFGWQSIFYVNVPIGIVGYILGRILLPGGEQHRNERFDFIGALLFALGVFSLMLVISQGHEWGWSSMPVLAAAGVALSSLGIFGWWEKKTPQPMLDLSMFHNWPYLAGNAAGFCSFLTLSANAVLLPFYLHTVLHLSSMQMGFLLMSFPVVLIFIAPISGYLSEKVNMVVLTSGGLTLTAVGLYHMASLNSESSMLQVIAGQAVLGLGNGMFQSPNNNSVLLSVAPAKLGLAGGINALVRNLGMISGTAIAISIFEGYRYRTLQGISFPSAVQQTEAFLSGYHAALTAAIIFACIGILISLNRKGYAKMKPTFRLP